MESAILTTIYLKQKRFATAKRMLTSILRILNMHLDNIGQLHTPVEKNKKWVWKMVHYGNDPGRRTPVFFNVEQETLKATLTVTRKSPDRIDLWTFTCPPGPQGLKGLNGEEVLRELGF